MVCAYVHLFFFWLAAYEKGEFFMLGIYHSFDGQRPVRNYCSFMQLDSFFPHTLLARPFSLLSIFSPFFLAGGFCYIIHKQVHETLACNGRRVRVFAGEQFSMTPAKDDDDLLSVLTPYIANVSGIELI